MNLKNQPKESAYVKFILSRTLLPYKSATRNNQVAVTNSEINGKTCIKFLDGIQRNLVDTLKWSCVA